MEELAHLYHAEGLIAPHYFSQHSSCERQVMSHQISPAGSSGQSTTVHLVHLLSAICHLAAVMFAGISLLGAGYVPGAIITTSQMLL